MAYREAKAEGKRSYRKLRHIEIHRVRGENGGYKVIHHFESAGSYQPPVEHLFGKNDGQQMISHVAQNMGVPMEPAEQ